MFFLQELFLWLAELCGSSEKEAKPPEENPFFEEGDVLSGVLAALFLISLGVLIFIATL